MLPGNLKHFQTFLSEDDKAVSRTEQKQNKISFLVFIMIKIRKKAKPLRKVLNSKKFTFEHNVINTVKFYCTQVPLA